MHKNSGLAPIIWVIVAAVFLGGGFVAYRIYNKNYLTDNKPVVETSDTEGWKTYRNEQYGFEVSYPLSWSVTDISSKKSGTGVKIESPTRSDIPGYTDIPASYRILISPHTDYYSIADFGSSKFPPQSWWNAGIDKKTTEETVEYKLGKQIIASFKFTDTAVPGSDIMATFRNPEFGISFEYPTRYSVLRLPGQTDVGALPLLEYKAPDKFAYDTIAVSWLPFKQGQNVEQVMVNNVVYDGSGAHPKSFDSFVLVHLGDNDFYKIGTGLFEGVLGYQYYLVRDSGAFVFTLTSSGVPWTDPSYDSEKDPRLLDLQEILRTVKLSN